MTRIKLDQDLGPDVGQAIRDMSTPEQHLEFIFSTISSAIREHQPWHCAQSRKHVERFEHGSGAVHIAPPPASPDAVADHPGCATGRRLSTISVAL